MNIFNRLIVIAFDLILMAGAVMLFLVAAQIIRPEEYLLPYWVEAAGASITALSVTMKVLAAFLAAAIFLIGLILLYLELRPARKFESHLTVRQDMLGTVTVSTNSVSQIVKREASTIPGVLEVSARVKDQNEGLRIFSNVAVDPSVNIAELGRVLQERVKAAVEQALSLSVVEVRVETQVGTNNGKQRVRRLS